MAFDKSQFIEQYKTEAREHLQKMSKGLLKLEKKPDDKELLDTMMREAHTIKGSSTMMGFKRIAEIAHKMEDGLEKALNKKIKLDKRHFDQLFKCLDTIEPLLGDKLTWEEAGISFPYVTDLCQETGNIFDQTSKQKVKEKQETKTKKKTKEQIPRPTAPNVPEAAVQRVTQDSTIRVGIDKLDKMMNLSGELLISKIRLGELSDKLFHKIEEMEGIDDVVKDMIKDLGVVNDNIDFIASNIQTDVMNLRLIPVSYLFDTFPRAMRDLATKKGKEITLKISGEDTQLDKSIIEEMKDPIMHLLRNAVDHATELPEEREKLGKSRDGHIWLRAYQRGSQVVIEVEDDGKGIDIDKVKDRAIERGIVAKEKADEMVDEQIMQILFTPGFSTADEVTDISGRGVGLDVVRDNIEKLKGMVEISSVQGKGTKFAMKLPLTVAITESLLVVSGRDKFAIPIDTVVGTVRIKPNEISMVEGKEAITMRGHIMPLVRLGDLFGLPRRGIVEKRFFPVVVVQSVEKKIGILVDELIGRSDIVSKQIGTPLKKVRDVSGATILGDGSVIIILDVPSIIKSAEGIVIRPVSAPAKFTKVKKRKTILLAEDAISTAALEKNILESVGYAVVVAHDGREALEVASQEKFDLVITDILMPRMNGFELTTALKNDKIYKDIPIIIVTTRESDSDKRKGLEAGADAYLLKSEFTSEGLLETIERLIG